MNLHDLQRHWDAFGEQDPMWAILTDPARKGRRWTAAEFFATGVAEIDALMAEARGFGVPAERRHALDVEALLAGAGVRLLRVRAEAHCGPRWEAFRYDVTAESAR